MDRSGDDIGDFVGARSIMLTGLNDPTRHIPPDFFSDQPAMAVASNLKEQGLQAAS